jgi:hypothetical protein
MTAARSSHRLAANREAMDGRADTPPRMKLGALESLAVGGLAGAVAKVPRGAYHRLSVYHSDEVLTCRRAGWPGRWPRYLVVHTIALVFFTVMRY